MSNLLLVDDDNFVRSALSRALNRTGGFTVIPAEHGRHALELLRTERVDAILTDLQMPVMDGLTLLAQLFEQGVRLPIAVMTGQLIHGELRHRLQAYGIAAVFSKPVDVVSLADELQRVLDPKTVRRITGVTLLGLLQLLEVERQAASSRIRRRTLARTASSRKSSRSTARLVPQSCGREAERSSEKSRWGAGSRWNGPRESPRSSCRRRCNSTIASRTSCSH